MTSPRPTSTPSAATGVRLYALTHIRTGLHGREVRAGDRKEPRHRGARDPGGGVNAGPRGSLPPEPGGQSGRGGPALAFDGVSLTLGQTGILQGVDLRVAAGGVHALVGPNGGGKSSLFSPPGPGAAPRSRIELVRRAAALVDAGLPMTVLDSGAMCQRRRCLGPSRRWQVPVGRPCGGWACGTRRVAAWVPSARAPARAGAGADPRA